mgnify:CR=1 FL=1
MRVFLSRWNFGGGIAPSPSEPQFAGDARKIVSLEALLSGGSAGLDGLFLAALLSVDVPFGSLLWPIQSFQLASTLGG